MPVVDRDKLRQKSRAELKDLRSEADAEIDRLGSALEDEKEELNTLQTRARKGDPAAEGQIGDQRDTCRKLRGKLNEQRTRRSAISDVLRQMPDVESDDGDDWDADRRKKYGL